MNNFYKKMTRTKKIIFLILTIPLSVLIGGIVGALVGMYAINFIPDQCVVEGAATVCQNPFEFLGLVGWEGTTMLGIILGVILTLTIYLIIILRPELKK
jgi:hypothetical protein